MTTKKKMPLRFYQNLGKLFYAVAAADNKVHPSEFLKLKDIVKSKWLDLDPVNDVFDTDAAYQIEIVFDWLQNEERVSVDNCYKGFITYKNEQDHLFTDVVKRLILKTASDIAYAFSGINKSELILLAKLDIEFKK
jgi:hypothetical protein